MDTPVKAKPAADLRAIWRKSEPLSWVRTGIALVGFEFVVARFGIRRHTDELANDVANRGAGIRRAGGEHADSERHASYRMSEKRETTISCDRSVATINVARWFCIAHVRTGSAVSSLSSVIG
jgi:hypothetical protein